MGRAETAAAGRDIADRPSGQESMQALEIAIVLDRYVVMHPDLALLEPGSGALDRAGAAFVQADETAARRRMGGERERFDRIERLGRGAGHDDQDLIGLPDRLAGPVGQVSSAR